jgi:hypothetical protein
MADKQTSLITGSNAKIKINGVTLAYAVDFQYNTDVSTIPVEVMGCYEVKANEPISVMINGSFTVVRYTKAAKAGSISNAAANGNGIGNWGTKTGGETAATANMNNGISSHFNPKDILTSKTVDIEAYQKFKNSPSAAADSTLIKKINNARVIRMSGSVNKRGILMETFQFVAETMDDDSFTSAPSGEEDLS